MIIVYSLISAFIIMLASLSGAIFIRKELGSWMQKRLKYLVTFSAGVFLAIVIHLIQEIFHESTSSWIVVLGWIAVGVLVIEILSHLIPKAHHHHGEESHDHSHSKIDARRMLLGDAMHNIGDGLLLVPAFIVDLRVGIVTTLAILVHELVQEISEFFVLREAGYTNAQALGRNLLVSTTIFVGVGFSFTASVMAHLETPLIAFSIGGFLYIIFRDLLPHGIHSMKTHGNISKHLIAFLIGIAVMYTITVLVPHDVSKPQTFLSCEVAGFCT